MSALAEQSSNYRAVRERLWPSKPIAPNERVQPKTTALVVDGVNISALRASLFEAERQVKMKQALIEKLALDLADANARLLAQAEMLASNSSSDSVPLPGNLKKPIKQIIDEVLSGYPDVTWEDLKGVRRTRRLIEPRQRCMYEIFTQRPDLSFPAIGRLFGGRDHTTVMHSVNKIKAEREKENA